MRARRRPGRIARAAAVVVAGAAVALAAASPRAAWAYDHLAHDGKLAVAGRPQPECSTCHQANRLLPTHATCFTSACHRARRFTAREQKDVVCAACHARGSGGPDFSLGFVHARHAAATGCERCHQVPPAKRGPPSAASPAPAASGGASGAGASGAGASGAGASGAGMPAPTAPARAAPAPDATAPGAPGATAPAATAPGATAGRDPSGRSPAVAGVGGHVPHGSDNTPHARCAPCHSAGPQAHAPLLGACTGCHRPIAGRDTSPRLADNPYAVIFDHAAHLRRLPHGADRCLPCHAEAARASGETVPAPAMTACETCHDGAQAFSTLATACRRCHGQVDRRSMPGDAPRLPYDHAAHAKRGVTVACAGCHRLDARDTPLPAAATHTPCSDRGCHASDFRSPTPRTCGACHVGTEPWRALAADAPRRARTEFGVEFSHGGHLEGTPPLVAGGCDSCHVGIRGGPDERLGNGHASCAGARCHGGGPTVGPAKPGFADCTACHRAGLLPTRDRRRAEAPWSVAGRFRHDVPHTRPSCTTCHTTAAAARTVDVIETPRKTTCAPCHDGTAAFKLTGQACARCHGRGAADAP
jgi:c(7)-type cytochrome triheme protein